MIGETRKRRKEWKEIFEAMMTENFPQINARNQTTDPGSLENTKKNNCHIILKLRNVKDKEQILKKARGTKCLIYREAQIGIRFDFSETMQARGGDLTSLHLH